MTRDGGKSMRDRMLAGEPYLADDPQLGRESTRAQVLTRRFNTLPPEDHDGRRAVVTELFAAFGEDSEIRPPLQCDYGYQTSFGARSFANWGLVCVDVATVTIGDDVQIGPGVQLLTATHPIEPGPRRDKWEAA
jgi:maltose O-acetyltransferase